MEGTAWVVCTAGRVGFGNGAMVGQVSSSCVWLEIDCLTNKGSKCDCLSCHEENIYRMSYFQNMLQQTV